MAVPKRDYRNVVATVVVQLENNSNRDMWNARSATTHLPHHASRLAVFKGSMLELTLQLNKRNKKVCHGHTFFVMQIGT